MAQMEELGVGALSASSPPAGVERRRPGRVVHVSAELVPLLRHPRPIGAEAAALLEDMPAPQAAEQDDLAPARGIVVALAISLVLWAACYAVVALIM